MNFTMKFGKVKAIFFTFILCSDQIGSSGFNLLRLTNIPFKEELIDQIVLFCSFEDVE